VRIAPLRGPGVARTLAVAAIAAGGLGAAVLPSSADVSAQSPSVAAVRVESPATLIARGAAIRVPVTVVCQPGGQAFLSVTVAQNAGGEIARSSDFMSISSCTGDFQRFDLSMISETSAPFRRGVAFATATLNVPGNPGPATDEREIKIVRSTTDAE
jgi:hypothetical protein